MNHLFQVINLADNISPNEKRSLALGMFDGVHLGHQAVFNAANEYAQSNKNIISCATTFAEPPIKWTSPNLCIELITTLEERLDLFKRFGIKQAIVLNFPEISQLRADDYLNNILKEALNCAFLSFGHNHYFGKGRQGTPEYMKQWADENQIQAELIGALKNSDGEIISSSLIRNLLRHGELKKANRFLGHSFLISGELIAGKQLGRKLGYPTLNCIYSANKTPLRLGVYAALTEINGKAHPSAINFGMAPTTDRNSTEPILESHLLEWENYSPPKLGDKFKIELVDFIRPEQKFASLEALKEQIAKDCKNIKNVLRN